MVKGLGLVVAAGAALTSVEQVEGQTITAAGGNAIYTFNSGAVPTTDTGIGGGSCNLDINGPMTGGDNMLENWWWYRVDGVDSREHRYSAPSNPFTAAGDTMTGTFNFAEFRSELRYQVTDPDGAGQQTAHVASRNTVTNTSALARTINLFHFADFNVNAETDGNVYGYDGRNETFSITDAAPSVSTANFSGWGFAGYQAAPFTAVSGSAVRGLVADDDIDDLDNTVTGSPGDFTGAFQWTISLNPGQTFTILSTLSVNLPVIPAPGAASMFGVAGIAAVRRRLWCVDQLASCTGVKHD